MSPPPRRNSRRRRRRKPPPSLSAHSPKRIDADGEKYGAQRGADDVEQAVEQEQQAGREPKVGGEAEEREASCCGVCVVCRVCRG